VLGRKVRASVERDAFGSQEHRHGPAAAAGHRLDGLHVDLVDVGPLLAVDLDVDEQLVHDASDVVVLEGLALHDVAPVTRRVAHREQHRPVLLLGPREGLRPPRVPVHRVVGVLQEVWARLRGEPVGVLVLTHGAASTNGSAATVAAIGPGSSVTVTALPGSKCSRRTYASAIGLPSAGERTAEVTRPTSFPSAVTR